MDILKKINNKLKFSVTNAWFQRKPKLVLYSLYPLAKIFEYLANKRYQQFKKTARKQKYRASIVIVGNLTVGGNGKTPAIIGLTHFLREHGYTPGIVSRGYGGKAKYYPYAITTTSKVKETGDEALLLCQELVAPVVIDPQRARAVDYLLAHYPQVDIVLSDDGLQHYPLVRDVEIVIIDSARGFGNGWCLPAGPLREPIERLASVNLVIAQNNQHEISNHNWPATFCLEPQCFVPLIATESKKPLDFAFTTPIHAVAAIGNPARFFATLRALGLDVIEHMYPDHYWFTPQDLEFNDQYPIIMTAKDAVKCKPFAKPNWWYLQVATTFNAQAQIELKKLFSPHSSLFL